MQSSFTLREGSLTVCCCSVTVSCLIPCNPMDGSTPVSSVLHQPLLVIVTQSCPTLCDPMDCSPPGSSFHGILQARILEWISIPSPGDLPDRGIEPGSLCSRQIPCYLSHQGSLYLPEFAQIQVHWVGDAI